MRSLFAIRRVGTEKFLPMLEPFTRATHSEPTDWRVRCPRYFQSRRAAELALTSWLKGRVEAVDTMPDDPMGGIEYHYFADPTRRRADFEIVEYEQTERRK